MTTKIISNGSKFAGEALDTLDQLKERLRTETLDPMFEDYGCFAINVPSRPGFVQFWGNFLNLSAVFDVITDDADLCAELSSLIKNNMATVAYKEARDEYVAAQAKAQEQRLARFAAYQKTRYQ